MAAVDAWNSIATEKSWEISAAPNQGKISADAGNPEWRLVSAPVVAPLSQRGQQQEWLHLSSHKEWKRHMEKSFMHLDEILKTNELQPYCRFCPGQIITATHLLGKNHLSCLPCCQENSSEEVVAVAVEASNYQQEIALLGGLVAFNHINGEIKMLVTDSTELGAVETAQLPPLPPSLSSAASSTEDASQWESEHRPHAKKVKSTAFSEAVQSAGFTSFLWRQFAKQSIRGFKENISNCLDSVRYCQLCQGPVANFKKHLLAEDHQHQVMMKHAEAGEDSELFVQVFADGACCINHLTLETSCTDDISSASAAPVYSQGPGAGDITIKEEHLSLLALLAVGNALLIAGLGFRLLSSARSGASK